MTMKIIFICSDPEYKKGEQYTPEAELYVSIKHAARAAAEIDSIIQAIDINDLSDVQDVTQQVAEALTRDLYENVETVPQYALSVDMHEFICELEANDAEENQYQRDVEAQYSAGRL